MGVFFAGGSRGSVVGNQISGNGVGAEFAAGIWAQAGAGGQEGLTIEGNTITGNKYVGIGLTSGARAMITDNTAIDETEGGTVFVGVEQVVIGDGIGVFDSAYAAITGNMIRNSGRFGVILDEVDGSSTLDGNTISGNAEFGVVVQNQAMGLDLGSNQADSIVADPPFVVQKEDVATP
jgi:parallel beta-helix repeat protein